MEGKNMKPTLIHSKILNETIYLTDVPIPGKTCYSQKEIEFLKTATQTMEEEEYAIYLRKIHQVKKAFPESKIEDVKMEARQPERGDASQLINDGRAFTSFNPELHVSNKMEARQEDVAGMSFREESTDLRVEVAEEPVAPIIPKQKSMWED